MAETLYVVTFWLTIAFVVLGGILGLAGVWLEAFWKSEAGWRLILTDLILAGSSLAIAIITKWLR